MTALLMEETIIAYSHQMYNTLLSLQWDCNATCMNLKAMLPNQTMIVTSVSAIPAWNK